MILPLAIMFVLCISPMITQTTKAANPGPFFSISILAPNTNPARNQWATLMVEQLPKIGIAVETFDHTGWAQISPRTWGHAGPIPTYAEGGYDILFVGWSWGLDWDPTGLYDSPAITPNGDNFYQYDSPAMDAAIGNYTSSFVLADRIEWAEEIQALLYEDLPEICLIYPLSVYPHVEDVDNFSGLLWASVYYPFHDMTIAGETEFHYATPADFEDFHIMTYESVYDAQWLRQIYNGMIERDPTLDNGYAPWLCESYSSADGLTYDVVIDDDATWADGTDLTTVDIEYNYELAITQSLGGTGYSTNIQYWDNDSVAITSTKEFSITFLQTYVFQDGNLALDLIPEHIWGAIAPSAHQAQAITWAKDNPENMFGAGPYMLEDYDATNGVIELAANPHFVDWKGVAPTFTKVFFEFYGSKEGALAALAAGSIDMVDSQFSPQLDELDIAGATYTLVEDPGTQEMAINMEHPWIGTGELCPIVGEQSANYIRKAISHMVPREIIVEEILNGLGTPATTGCPNVAVGYDTSLVPYEYSINLALQYMKDAGFDVTPVDTGIGLVVVFSILALAGASQVFFLKRRK